MADLDSIIHQPVRLRIMASLCSMGEHGQVDFAYLRDLLGVTDGNLGAHLQKLEEASYVEVQKTFAGRKPRTLIRATLRGRSAFEEHVAALRSVLEGK